MRLGILFIVISFFTSCFIEESGEVKMENSMPKSDGDSEPLTENKNLQKVQGEDQLRQELFSLQTDFIGAARQGNFSKCQDLICEEGLMFFTAGRISKNNFDQDGLSKVQMKMDGAYVYGEGSPDWIINGMFWVDSLTNYKDSLYGMYSTYDVLGFGFTGNYDSTICCSNNGSVIDYGENDSIRILYTDHKFRSGFEYLMTEFRKRDDKWKLYLIGNLEWTP